LRRLILFLLVVVLLPAFAWAGNVSVPRSSLKALVSTAIWGATARRAAVLIGGVALVWDLLDIGKTLDERFEGARHIQFNYDERGYTCDSTGCSGPAVPDGYSVNRQSVISEVVYDHPVQGSLKGVDVSDGGLVITQTWTAVKRIDCAQVGRVGACKDADSRYLWEEKTFERELVADRWEEAFAVPDSDGRIRDVFVRDLDADFDADEFVDVMPPAQLVDAEQLTADDVIVEVDDSVQNDDYVDVQIEDTQVEDTQAEDTQAEDTQFKDVAVSADEIAQSIDDKIAESVSSVSVPVLPDVPVFDTAVEAPEPPDIVEKVKSLFPLLNLSQRVQLSFDGYCSLTGTLDIFGESRAYEIDFCRYSSQLQQLGDILVMIAAFVSLLIIFGLL